MNEPSNADDDRRTLERLAALSRLWGCEGLRGEPQDQAQACIEFAHEAPWQGSHELGEPCLVDC